MWAIVSPVNLADPMLRSLTALFLTPILVFGLVTSSGCATLLAAGPDHVPVNTNPPGAYVYLNGVFVGQAPTVVYLDRDRGGQIQIYLPGFQPVVMTRSKSLNGWFIGSILLFYTVIPLLIDLATGNYVRFDDEPIAIGLMPMQGPPPQWYQQQPPQGQQQPQQPPYPQQPPQPYQPPPTAQPPIVQPPNAPPPQR